MEFFYKLLNKVPSTDYTGAMERRKEAMDFYLWNSTTNQWHDYCTKNGSQIIRSYPSNWFPLWSGAYDKTNETFKELVYSSLLKSGLVQEGGVLSTDVASGQQWDSPNAWAPHQSFIVQVLLALDTPESRELAQTIAVRWIKATYIGYQESKIMHEKYNGFLPGQPGDGGEYPPQVGFGWTNGVTLEFLNMYGNMVDSAL